MTEKEFLRSRMLEIRDQLNVHYRISQSQKICTSVLEYIEKLEIPDMVIHTFLSMRSEVNLYPLLTQLLHTNMDLIAPKTLKNRVLENIRLTSLNLLEKGSFGTKHPAHPTPYEGKIDVVIVPGVAFDKSGNRLGYGGGYYDTMLERYPDAKKIAVCFPEQIQNFIPTEEHDVVMDEVFVR